MSVVEDMAKDSRPEDRGDNRMEQDRCVRVVETTFISFIVEVCGLFLLLLVIKI